MTRVEVAFHFSVDHMEVDVSVLGSEISVKREGFPMTLRIPSDADDFAYGYQDPEPALSGWVEDSATGEILRRTVTMLRVMVELELPLPTGSLAHVERERLEDSRDRLRNAADAARRVVRLYLDAARVDHGLYWLGTSPSKPTITWMTKIWEVGTGDVVNTGFHDPLAVVHVGRSFLTSLDHRTIAERVRADDDNMDLARSMLADARRLGLVFGQRREAVVFAAASLEVGIKEHLTRACPPITSDLLAVQLPRFRPTKDLFSTIAQATTGRSLAVEDQDLHRRVAQLFEHRNGIVHRGEDVTGDQMSDDLACAVDVLAWTESL